MLDLRGVFDKYGLEQLGGVSWKVMLRNHLYKAAAPVQVGLRNSDAKNSFSYEQNPDGLSVIAIGGKKIVINAVVRKFLIDENQMTLSGTKLRLVGREIAQFGLTADEVTTIENKFYADAKNHGKELPAVAYLIHGRRPLLVLYAVQPKIDAPHASNVLKVLFALGLGFPAANPAVSESQIKTADFVINAVGNEEGVEE